jgi:hypothetical protein
MRAAVTYPQPSRWTRLTSGVTTITTKVKISVQRAMTDAARKRVSDALQHGGYSILSTRFGPSRRWVRSKRRDHR